MRVDKPTQARSVLTHELVDETLLAELKAARFSLENCGEEGTNVAFVSSSCGCLEVQLDGTPIQRGDIFRLDAGNIRVIELQQPVDASFSGWKTNSIIVQPENSDPVKLSSTIKVFQDLLFSPSVVVVQFENREQSEKIVSSKLRVSAASEDSFRIPEIVCCSEHAKLESATRLGLPIEIGDGIWSQTYDVRLALKPDWDQAGKSNDVIDCLVTASITGEDEKEIKRTMRCRIERNYGIRAPKLVHLGLMYPDQKRSRKIQLKSVVGSEFVITGIGCDNADLTGEILDPNPAQIHWINISATSNAPGDFLDRLVVKTDHPDADEFEIEVRASIRESN